MAVQDVYGKSLHVEKAVDFWRRETESALSRGFSGLAESADGTSVLSEDLLRFEATLGRELRIDSMTALCLYDARRFDLGSENLLLKLLSTHGHVIFPGVAGRMYERLYLVAAFGRGREACFMSEERSKEPSEAALFSIARFGHGSIMILLFIAITTILFYLFGLRSFALLLSGVGAVFFGVKSMERIHLIPIQERKLIGELCRVIKPVRMGRQGVVRMVKPDGTMESDLWSAESAHEIEAGKDARVIGKRSIVLLIEPLTD